MRASIDVPPRFASVQRRRNLLVGASGVGLRAASMAVSRASAAFSIATPANALSANAASANAPSAITPRSNRLAERGATAVEFALLFPLFFLILYAIVTYSLIFVAQQSLTLAAEEGARAALAYQEAATVPAALQARATAACTTATGVSGWLSGHASCSATPAACSYDASMDCVQVTLDYDYAGYPLVPSLPLLSLVLPKSLSSTSTVQLNPENVL